MVVRLKVMIFIGIMISRDDRIMFNPYKNTNARHNLFNNFTIFIAIFHHIKYYDKWQFLCIYFNIFIHDEIFAYGLLKHELKLHCLNNLFRHQ